MMHCEWRLVSTGPKATAPQCPTRNVRKMWLQLFLVCWMLYACGYVEACQSPLKPIYNSTQRQYVSCNAWEPDCPAGAFCQMATMEWKTRLQIHSEFSLFLCCADETLFKNGNGPLTVSPAPSPQPHPQPPPPVPMAQTKAPPPIQPNPSQPQSSPAITNPVVKTLGKDHADFVPHHSDGNGHSNNQENTDDNDLANPTGSIHPQQPDTKAPGQPKLGSRNPILPPQAQIMLPGNGNRVIDGPQVIQLIVGEINQNGPDGMFKYSGSISLIQDSGLNILVDSGSAQTRNKLLAALAQQGIKPQNIQLVVYTHAHPDHIGNDNLFPYAQKLYSTNLYKGDEYMPLQLMQEPSIRLTQNVEIWQTPGHTFQHNSLIVRNVPNEGDVAISGDLFMNEDGMNNPAIWQSVSVDKEIQAQTRNVIICQVDYIIPGHGSPFRITHQQKSAAGCTARSSNHRGRRTRIRIQKPAS